jgi:hypothetical protein
MRMKRCVYGLSKTVTLASAFLLSVAMTSRAVAQATIQPGIWLMLTPFASGLGGEAHGSPGEVVPIENFNGKVLLSIGEDEDVELYAVLGDDPGGFMGGNSDGVVLRLAPPLQR